MNDVVVKRPKPKATTAALNFPICSSTSTQNLEFLPLGATLQHDGGLEHRPRISDVIHHAGVPATARVSVVDTDSLVVIQCALMFGIDQASVLHLDQLAHHGQHIVFAHVDEGLGVVIVRDSNDRIPVMHMIDTVAGTKVFADLDGINFHLAGDTALV